MSEQLPQWVASSINHAVSELWRKNWKGLLARGER